MEYLYNIFKQQKKIHILIQFIVGFLFSGIFLYLFLKNFEFKDVLNILFQLIYYNFIWVLLATAAHLLAKAIRWKVIISSLKDISLLSSLSNISIGLMANNLLPARAGEFVRVASLSQTEALSISGVLSALVLERLLDGYVLLFFFMLSSYQVNFVQSVEVMAGLQKAAITAFILYSCVLMGLMLFMKYGTSHRFENIIPSKLKFLVLKIAEFNAGLSVIKDFKKMFLICFWSVAAWLLSAAVIMATLSMFLSVQTDMYKYIGYSESIFLNGAVSLVLMIPAVPGYFGSFHLICSVVLVGFGLTKGFSDSFAIFIHGTQYLLITLIGFSFFVTSHLNLKKLAKTEILDNRNINKKSC